jgi:hypothetical protein
MSYRRVIPRDLFNEANLLKCYGQIYLNVESLPVEYAAVVSLEWDGEGTLDAFAIEQREDDGSLSCANVSLMVADTAVRLHRPLNSREPWPLYATPDDDTELSVFDAGGHFSPAFMAYLGGFI